MRWLRFLRYLFCKHRWTVLDGHDPWGMCSFQCKRCGEVVP